MRTSKYAKNKTLLAARIGISRPALRRLFERGDYPPQVAGKGWDVEQWQRYSNNNIATWNRRDKSNGSGHGPRSSILLLEAAKIERQKLAAEREQFDLDVKRGMYEKKTVVREQILTHVNALFRELDKAFRHELPPRIEGLSAGAIAKLNGKRLDELRERLAKHFESNGNGA